MTMSSDEDFTVLMESPTAPPTQTLEQQQALIHKYKKQHEQLLEEQRDLAKSRDQSRALAAQFTQRTHQITQIIRAKQEGYDKDMGQAKLKLENLRQEEAELRRGLQEAEEALREEEAKSGSLREKAKVLSSMPRRRMKFSGVLETPDKAARFDVKSHLVYPMEGGTALVTFEEDTVADKVLAKGRHEVPLGEDCRIFVEAKPFHLLLPKHVEIDTEVCPRRILISNLPKVDLDLLLNRLEIHFSKTRHGGGEVDGCQMYHDMEAVVLTFVGSDIAGGLVAREQHDVEIKGQTYRVRVAPYLNGAITSLKTEMSVCRHIVLLTGIPDVMDRELLQDMLEIHFQKSTNGGGEIEALIYNPVGEHISAVLEGDTAKRPEEGAKAL